MVTNQNRYKNVLKKQNKSDEEIKNLMENGRSVLEKECIILKKLILEILHNRKIE